MREMFPGYNQLDDEGYEKLWNECIFSADANVLLNPYRSGPDLQSTFFQVFERLKDQIWITNQAVIDFYENRPSVISAQSAIYKTVEDHLTKFVAYLKDTHNKTKDHHLTIKVDELIFVLEPAVKESQKLLAEQCKNHPQFEPDDSVLKQILGILDGRVGEGYSNDELLRIYQQAEFRYKMLIPPGYEDDHDKQSFKRFGDVVVWFQLIDHAKAMKRPIIFITDDAKDDWWAGRQGHRSGPRPELVQEMFRQAQVRFHMYSSDNFLVRANKYLDLKASTEVIDEAKAITRQVGLLQRIADTEQRNVRYHSNPTITDLQARPLSIRQEWARLSEEIEEFSSPNRSHQVNRDGLPYYKLRLAKARYALHHLRSLERQIMQDIQNAQFDQIAAESNFFNVEPQPYSPSMDLLYDQEPEPELYEPEPDMEEGGN